MKISLNEETRQRIRTALGNDVDLAPDLVPSVLARLAVEAPSVYSEVLGELSGSQIRLDSEEEFVRRRRRGMLRRLLFSWGEYESGAGDRLIDKRHVAAVVPLMLALLTTMLLAFSLVVGHRVSPGPAQPRIVAHMPPRTVVRQEMGISPIVPRRDPLVTPSPSSPLSRSSFAGMLPVPALPPSLSGLPDSPGFFPRGVGSPVVVSLQDSPTRQIGGTAARGPGGLPPIVYNRSTDVDSARRETTEHLADGAASKTGEASPATRGAGSALPSLAPGTRLPATLLTGAVVVPGGSPVPVVVETSEPHGIWMGQAVLGPGDRVQVTLSLATQNRTGGTRGIALDSDRLLPGIPGRTTVRHSSTVAAMAAATVQATSDYAQAAARQGSLSVFDGLGSIVVGGQLPEPWTYLAARLAKEFHAPGTPGGWVTTTEIPAGTQITILITGAS
jgi:hypothetical protein